MYSTIGDTSKESNEGLFFFFEKIEIMNDTNILCQILMFIKSLAASILPQETRLKRWNLSFSRSGFKL